MLTLPTPDSASFRWDLLRHREAGAVHAVHVQALRGVATGLVRRDGRSHFQRHTGQEGLILACTARHQLVAYGVLGIHSEAVAHLAELLALDPTQQRRFAILDGAAVLPAWRGYSLHQESIAERIRHALQTGRTLIGATVAPCNYYSMDGLLQAGFVITGFARMYHGLDRLLLKRDLLAVESHWRLALQVPCADVNGHQMALAAGLHGYACLPAANGDWQVQYGTPEPALSGHSTAMRKSALLEPV